MQYCERVSNVKKMKLDSLLQITDERLFLLNRFPVYGFPLV